MAKISSIIIGVFMLLALAINANARQPSGLEQRELVLLVKNINDAVEKKDFSILVNSMPERLYKEMAIKMYTTEVVLREDFKKQITQQFSNVIEGGYQLDGDKIEYKETADGTFYALIPTRFETSQAVIESQTLAIFDNTKWHIVLGGQKTVQNPVFLEIYPSFQNVSVPVGKAIAK
ncbi:MULTISPECIES: hypothetical protein [unclassified Bartonella]|uniref:hypothetical protein n=1 Tax=unclassified Bartonella TaxID=2645622 RepID=UPI0021C7A33C|nr:MULTISPECIES: hypothetical protein [unclassified Bartonella]UXN02360.1 hypothetical protein N6B01_07585 [Bartonella sp. HY406]UXN05314.1 hypothetical protein N6A79_08260 [Bartonella sp. HY761]